MPTDAADPFPDFQGEIREGMSNLADYIWKLPRFIEAERELEQQKLWSYFPLQRNPAEEERVGQLRRLRAFHEFGKILIDFPHHMATSNLFLACSVFERQLLKLCNSAEDLRPRHSAGARGRGVSGLLRRVADQGIEPSGLRFHEQVLCAMDLRNCLLHADGDLAFSSNGDRIRQIVERRLFLDAKIRKSHPNPSSHVHINSREDGDFLVVENNYPHFLCSRFRDFLVALCEEFSVKIQSAVADSE